MDNNITLNDFNNIGKTVHICVYRSFYIANKHSGIIALLQWLDENYNAQKLEVLLARICKIINAQALNVSSQNYEPHGASATMLLSEPIGCVTDPVVSVLAHLDKSHLAVHTFHDISVDKNTCNIRVDIDISTCGSISPLKALKKIFDLLQPDLLHFQYLINGYTQGEDGRKIFPKVSKSDLLSYLNYNDIREYLFEISGPFANDRSINAKFIKNKINEDDENLLGSFCDEGVRCEQAQEIYNNLVEIYANI